MRYYFLSYIFLTLFFVIKTQEKNAITVSQNGIYAAFKETLSSPIITIINTENKDKKQLETPSKTTLFDFCGNTLIVPTAKKIFFYNNDERPKIIDIKSISPELSEPLAMACYSKKDTIDGRVAIAFQKKMPDLENQSDRERRHYYTEIVFFKYLINTLVQENSYYFTQEQADYQKSYPVALAFNTSNTDQLIFGFSKRHNQLTNDIIVADQKADTGTFFKTKNNFDIKTIQWKNNIIGILGKTLDQDNPSYDQSVTLYKFNDNNTALIPFIIVYKAHHFSLLHDDMLLISKGDDEQEFIILSYNPEKKAPYTQEEYHNTRYSSIFRMPYSSNQGLWTYTEDINSIKLMTIISHKVASSTTTASDTIRQNYFEHTFIKKYSSSSIVEKILWITLKMLQKLAIPFIYNNDDYNDE